MSRTRTLLALGAAGVGLSALAARRRQAAWKAVDDPDGPGWSAFPAGEERTVVTSDGARIAVTVAAGSAGGGSPVVLAHGWTENRTVWAPVARRLIARGHQVIAYDQRGHGASTTGRDPFSVTRLGADLREILVELDVHDSVLVGHSMGGMTVMALVGDDPVAVKQHARALVLVATAASGLSRGGRPDEIVGRVVSSAAVRWVMTTPAGVWLTRGALGKAPAYDHMDATRRMLLESDRAVIGEALVALASMDIRGGLPGCPVPATVLVGTRDTLTRVSLAREIVAGIPDAQLEVFRGAGHMLPFERRDEVVAAIERAATTAA